MPYEGFLQTDEGEKKPLTPQEGQELRELRKKQFAGENYTEDDRKKLLELQGRESVEEDKGPLDAIEEQEMRKLEMGQGNDVGWDPKMIGKLEELQKRFKEHNKKRDK